MIIRRVLEDSIVVGRLIELYTDSDDSLSFSVGQLAGLSDDGYALLTLDQNGEMDGWHVGRIDDVFKVGYETRYLTALTRIGSNLLVSDGPLPSITMAIEQARAVREIVSIVAADRKRTFAQVLELSDDDLLIRQIEEDGRDGGFEAWSLDSIYRIHLRGPEEEAVQILRQRNALND